MDASLIQTIINKDTIYCISDDQSIYLYDVNNITDFADVRLVNKELSCMAQLSETMLVVGDEEMGNINIIDIKEVTDHDNINGGGMKISKNLGDNIQKENEVQFDPVISMSVSNEKELLCVN